MANRSHLATRSQSGLSPGRRSPPGCGFHKELAAYANAYPARAFARAPASTRLRLPEGTSRQSSGDWSSAKEVRTWSSGKSERSGLWLTTSTLPGISIDEPCLQRPSELRPPSPGFRPDASLRPAAASQRNSPLKPTHTQPRLSPGSRTPSGSSFLKKQTAKFWELVGHEKE